MQNLNVFQRPFYLLSLLAILCFYGCSDHPKVKTKAPVAPKINNVHLFIETSASMGGYFRNDAQYKTIVSDLAVKVNQTISPVDIWFIADSLVKYGKTPVQFSSDIATTQIANRKSSELHQIISRIAAKTGANDVSILVSDCILSFPNADIKANPNINKIAAPSALKNNIYAAFSDLRKKGMGTSVYAFKSKFYGDYYDFQNVKTKLNGESRPFYIWVIANTQTLSAFDEKLADINSFIPEKSLHFGLIDSAVTQYSIIPQVEKKGVWQKESATSLKKVEISAGKPVQVCLAVNLNQLPAYAREVAYLEKNLQVICKDCRTSLVVKEKAQADRAKLKTITQKQDLDAATHVLLLTVNQMDLNKSDIQLKLPLKYDTWYLDWSCPDDKVPAERANKTFAFEYLVNGVKEAYETKNKNYIDFNITINK